MKIRQAIDARREARCGSAAVVTYLPAPLGPYLTALRHSLDPQHNPQAHVTFLPPRELSVDAEACARQVEQALRSVEPFEVELGCVNVFPKTNILYLNIHHGYESFLGIHETLNQGLLFAKENFEFIPHVTLSGPLEVQVIDANLERAEAAWSAAHMSRRFNVTEVTLLWQEDYSSEQNWSRLSSFPLRKADGVSAG